MSDYEQMDMPRNDEGETDFDRIAAALLIDAANHSGEPKHLSYNTRLKDSEQEFLPIRISQGRVDFPTDFMGNRFAASLYMALERLLEVKVTLVSIEDEEDPKPPG